MLLAPTIFILFLALMHSNLISFDFSPEKLQMTRCVSWDVYSVKDPSVPCITLAFAADGPADAATVEQVARRVASRSGLAYGSDIITVPNVDDLWSRTFAGVSNGLSPVIDAAVIVNYTDIAAGQFDYSLQFNVTSVYAYAAAAIDTIFTKTGYSGRLLAIQQAVDGAALDEILAGDKSVHARSVLGDITFGGFPSVATATGQGIGPATQLLSVAGCSFIVMGFTVAALLIMAMITSEKQRKLVGSLRTMGLLESAYWTSHSVSLLPVLFLAAVLAAGTGAATQLLVFAQASFGVHLVSMVLLAISLGSITLCCSSMMRRSGWVSLGSFCLFAGGVLMTIIWAGIPLYGIVVRPGTSPVLQMMNLPWPWFAYGNVYNSIYQTTTGNGPNATFVAASCIGQPVVNSPEMADSWVLESDYTPSDNAVPADLQGGFGYDVLSVRKLSTTEEAILRPPADSGAAPARYLARVEWEDQLHETVMSWVDEDVADVAIGVARLVRNLAAIPSHRAPTLAAAIAKHAELMDAGRALKAEDLPGLGQRAPETFAEAVEEARSFFESETQLGRDLAAMRELEQAVAAEPSPEPTQPVDTFFHWSNLYKRGGVFATLKRGHVICYRHHEPALFLWVMVWQAMCYFVVAWYLSQVMTADLGASQPIWFPLSPYYWGCATRTTELVEGDTLGMLKELSAREGSVRIHKMSKSYGEVQALRELSLTLAPGQLTALLGQNGCGKSTTVHCLAGLINPTHGEAFAFGKSVREEMSNLRDAVGLCPQHDLLWEELTPEQHIALVARFKGVPAAKLDETCKSMLRAVKLADVSSARTMTFSGGMKRRLSIAMAATGAGAYPRILFLDEPTTGLDPLSRRRVWDLIRDLKQDRITVLTTHDLEEADALGDSVAILATGRLRAVGSPLYLKSNFGKGFLVSILAAPSAIDELRQLAERIVPGLEVVGEAQDAQSAALNAGDATGLGIGVAGAAARYGLSVGNLVRSVNAEDSSVASKAGGAGGSGLNPSGQYAPPPSGPAAAAAGEVAVALPAAESDESSVRNMSGALTLSIPRSAAARIPVLLRELAARDPRSREGADGDAAQVKEWSVSNSSLEEVFLRLAATDQGVNGGASAGAAPDSALQGNAATRADLEEAVRAAYAAGLGPDASRPELLPVLLYDSPTVRAIGYVMPQMEPLQDARAAGAETAAAAGASESDRLLAECGDVRSALSDLSQAGASGSVAARAGKLKAGRQELQKEGEEEEEEEERGEEGGLVDHPGVAANAVPPPPPPASGGEGNAVAMAGGGDGGSGSLLPPVEARRPAPVPRRTRAKPVIPSIGYQSWAVLQLQLTMFAKASWWRHLCSVCCLLIGVVMTLLTSPKLILPTVKLYQQCPADLGGFYHMKPYDLCDERTWKTVMSESLVKGYRNRDQALVPWAGPNDLYLNGDDSYSHSTVLPQYRVVKAGFVLDQHIDVRGEQTWELPIYTYPNGQRVYHDYVNYFQMSRRVRMTTSYAPDVSWSSNYVPGTWSMDDEMAAIDRGPISIRLRDAPGSSARVGLRGQARTSTAAGGISSVSELDLLRFGLGNNNISSPTLSLVQHTAPGFDIHPASAPSGRDLVRRAQEQVTSSSSSGHMPDPCHSFGTGAPPSGWFWSDLGAATKWVRSNFPDVAIDIQQLEAAPQGDDWSFGLSYELSLWALQPGVLSALRVPISNARFTLYGSTDVYAAREGDHSDYCAKLGIAPDSDRLVGVPQWFGSLSGPMAASQAVNAMSNTFLRSSILAANGTAANVPPVPTDIGEVGYEPSWSWPRIRTALLPLPQVVFQAVAQAATIGYSALIWPLFTMFWMPELVHRIAVEKAEKQFQILRIGGLREEAYFLGHYIYAFIIGSLLMIVYTAAGYAFEAAPFWQVGPGVYVALIVAWCHAQAGWAVLLGAVLPTTAAKIVSYVLLVLLAVVTYSVVVLVHPWPMWLDFVPMFSYTRAAILTQGFGLHSIAPNSELALCLIITVLEGTIALFLGVYLHAVIPGPAQTGAPKHWLYCLRSCMKPSASKEPTMPGAAAEVGRRAQSPSVQMVGQGSGGAMATAVGGSGSGPAGDGSVPVLDKEVVTEAMAIADGEYGGPDAAVVADRVVKVYPTYIRKTKTRHGRSDTHRGRTAIGQAAAAGEGDGLLAGARLGEPDEEEEEEEEGAVEIIRERKAVAGVSLGLRYGETLVVLGPNGAGKSSLISIVCGDQHPTSGTVYVGGYDIGDHLRSAQNVLGVVPQFSVVFDDMTVREHLLLFARLKGVPPRLLSATVQSCAEKIGLDGDAYDSKATGLSGGQRRRLAIGMAVVTNPEIVILDEPSTGLDVETRRGIWQIVQNLRAQGRALLITTHSMAEAQALASRIAIMCSGQVEVAGTPLRLKREFAAGVTLSFHLASNSAEDRRRLDAEVLRLHPEAALIQHVGRIVSYSAPLASGQIADAFATLEELKARPRGPITEWGISQPTLEDVFVNTVEAVAERDNKGDEN